VCRLTSAPVVAFLSKTDQTGSVYQCTKVADTPSDLRAGYWLYKAFTWIEALPV
jgi:hypothetical protein